MFWLRIFFIFLKWVTYNKEAVGVVCTSGSVGVSVCRTTWLTVKSEDVNKWGWRKCGDTKCLRGATVSCVPAGQATGTKVSEGHTHVRVPHGQHRFTQALKTRSFIFVCGWRRCDYTSGCEENCHEGCGVGQARKVFSSAVLMSNKVSPAPRC